jgi:hypothetical protein
MGVEVLPSGASLLPAGVFGHPHISVSWLAAIQSAGSGSA